MIPVSFATLFDDTIARNRTRWFGRISTRRAPMPLNGTDSFEEYLRGLHTFYAAASGRVISTSLVCSRLRPSSAVLNPACEFVLAAQLNYRVRFRNWRRKVGPGTQGEIAVSLSRGGGSRAFPNAGVPHGWRRSSFLWENPCVGIAVLSGFTSRRDSIDQRPEGQRPATLRGFRLVDVAAPVPLFDPNDSGLKIDVPDLQSGRF